MEYDSFLLPPTKFTSSNHPTFLRYRMYEAEKLR